MQVRRMELEQTAARAGMVATPTVLSILGVFTYRASVEQEYGFERCRGFGAYGNNTEELLRSADGALYRQRCRATPRRHRRLTGGVLLV